MLYLHGGAYVLGSAFGYQPHAGALAAAAQTGVLVPDYRLAPEHPFPAAVDDALSAYRWLLEQGVAAERVTVAGDSAGGGLVMSLLLTLKRERRAFSWRGRLASAPGSTSGSATPHSGGRRAGRRPDGDESRAVRCAEAYLNGHPVDDPIVDPLPPTSPACRRCWFRPRQATPASPTPSCSRPAREAQGVDVRLELYPVQAHAFQLFWSFLPEAADAFEAAGEFISRGRGEIGDSAGPGTPPIKTRSGVAFYCGGVGSTPGSPAGRARG